MSESVEKLVSQVRHEVGQIDRLVTSYADLLRNARECTPGLVEITALGSVLHSFYHGLESIFLAIAKGLDGQVPSGRHWHRDLLAQMTRENARRGPVISLQAAEKLTDYMMFRHFFRHAYSFLLEWDELKKLVFPLHEVWAEVKQQLNQFLDTLVPGQGGRS